jgi:hypothetical protein
MASMSEGGIKVNGEGNIHCDTLSVDCGKISVFEEGDEVSLGGFLKRHDGGRLEAEIGLHASTS